MVKKKKKRKHADGKRKQPAGMLTRVRQWLRIGGNSTTTWLEGQDHNHWDEVGRAQYDYLVCHGLKPSHTLLDLPCGSFRAGRFLIDYLDSGKYFGVDASQKAVDSGRERVLEPKGLLQKTPTIKVSRLTEQHQDFGALLGCRAFDYVWVHALFDHIPHDVIRTSLLDMADVVKPGGRIFATIFLNPHGPEFREPMIRPRHGSIQDGVVTFPDREYWHHTVDFFRDCIRGHPTLRLDGCFFDYEHPLGLRMLRFTRVEQGRDDDAGRSPIP